ncbi:MULTISPECIES: SIS domain-containing protein [unclassified Clostridium]|uniref:SIS domain-containing protein n=1 Tax=unclassified Clostridium TaxID=2614128 RepID=UPI0025BE8000|nr:SIS domain-containing protein [Clostridium sp.]MCI6691678.1 SIS domain-containing protein [Clostridium sp.]MDY2632512.1 SIS domain-containing protein [Clostridium sp.]MDY6227373.1 SIS domain-containing protein [Clostridium sp.]
MKIFNIDENEMNKNSAIFTLKEIYQQPKTWLKTLAQIIENKDSIQEFINQVIKCDDYDVIFTGAGTSEFVGNALYAYLNKELNYKVKSYGTTDIVATPEAYISKNKPTLLISFGRSGNSPESIGAVEAASVVSNNLYNLFITCNKDGQLSKMSKEVKNCYAINLTEETHDQSFAMTSSFSNMYLAAYLCFNLDKLEEKSELINDIATATQNFLDNGFEVVNKIVTEYNFERIVYLGSNILKGISQESSLKMLELTAGKTVTNFDTPLGFRHGPKSIINDSTLTVVYVSDDEYTYKYELDLIKEISSQRKGNKLVVVTNKPNTELESLCDYIYAYNINHNLNNVELGLAYITFAQTLSVLKSLSMGLTPDNPCPSGEVNRVVKGVTLYPYTCK